MGEVQQEESLGLSDATMPGILRGLLRRIRRDHAHDQQSATLPGPEEISRGTRSPDKVFDQARIGALEIAIAVTDIGGVDGQMDGGLNAKVFIWSTN